MVFKNDNFMLNKDTNFIKIDILVGLCTGFKNKNRFFKHTQILHAFLK